MYISDTTIIPKKFLSADTMKNVSKQVLVGPDQGWDSHVMRVFTVGKDGYTPKHSHSWPHINYIISGEGVLFVDGKEYPVKAGGTAFVPGGSEHQFRQKGESEFSFICIVPREGDV